MRSFQQTVVVLCSSEAQPAWVREELEAALRAAGSPALVLPATPRVVEALRRLPELPRALVLCVEGEGAEASAGAELLEDAGYLARPGLRLFVARGTPGRACPGASPSCVPCPFTAPECFAAALRALPAQAPPAASVEAPPLPGAAPPAETPLRPAAARSDAAPTPGPRSRRRVPAVAAVP